MVRCIWDAPSFRAAPMAVRIAMIAGTAMEGGPCGEAGVGDNGCSHGPFQMNTCNGAGNGLPISCLTDAECATQHMLGSYTRCAGQHSNPIDIAFCAEQPLHYYSAGQIAAATAAIRNFLSDNPSLPNEPPNTPSNSGQPSASGPSAFDPCAPLLYVNPGAYAACKGAGGVASHGADIVNGFKDTKDAIVWFFDKLKDPKTYERLAIGMLGFWLVLIGAGVLVWNSGGNKVVIGTAKAVAKVA